MPYYEYDELVYWQGRSIYNKNFLFPPDTSKTKFIFGVDSLDFDGYAIITESIFNCLMFNKGVAIGGSIIDSEQIRLLKSFNVSKIIVAFDNDDAGVKGISDSYKLLCNDFNLFYSLAL